MPTETDRDEKLVQYLSEAYGKEKELETALEAHIGMTDRAPYKKRLRQHLRETKNHGRLVERRIKKLGGGGPLLKQLAGRGMAMAKGPLHALRGKSDEEKLLKNAKSEYSDEAEEIATYMAIETLAQTVGDKETAQVARRIRREEERMAAFLERQIPVLARAAARAEIPASERGARTRRPRRRTGTRRGGRSRTRARSGRSRTRSGRARSRS
jgi:ferritin-like metal-binding protein YciE